VKQKKIAKKTTAFDFELELNYEKQKRLFVEQVKSIDYHFYFVITFDGHLSNV